MIPPQNNDYVESISRNAFPLVQVDSCTHTLGRPRDGLERDALHSHCVVLFSQQDVGEDEEEKKLVPIGILYKIKTIRLVPILQIQSEL